MEKGYHNPGSTARPALDGMSPKLSRTSNSDLYKFHRPKLRVRDTPHPLKWESELCAHPSHSPNSTETANRQRRTLFPPFPTDASGTSQRTARSVQHRPTRAHTAPRCSWRSSWEERAIFTFCLASKGSTLASRQHRHPGCLTGAPRRSVRMLVTPRSQEERSTPATRRSRTPRCVLTPRRPLVSPIVTGLSLKRREAFEEVLLFTFRCAGCLR